jgi:anthranilate phosphoribosyltransferase
MSLPIEALRSRQNLTREEVRAAGAGLLAEEVPLESKATFLRALSAKGETPAEIAGFVEFFLEHAVDPGLSEGQVSGPMLDVCGTGGDKLEIFNVSTTVMFVAAAAGAVVVKHGNRAITSRSGGADVLEALGARIDLPPERFRECVRRSGIGFLFAPAYHPAFKAIAPVRQQLAREGTRTVFNLLGPLLNPVRPAHQLVGVFAEELVPPFADILHRLGRRRAWAVCGRTADGAAMDELSTLGPTSVCATAANGESWQEVLQPEPFGMQGGRLEDFRGGDAQANAAILTGILEGRERGAKADLVLLNAGAALVVAGLAAGIEDGIAKAREQIDCGGAVGKLRAFLQAAS